MTAPADLTILLGPQTTASLALNSVMREGRHQLSGKGLATLPSRLATPLLRRAIDDRPLDERKTEFEAETQKRPALLSAVSFFGPPQAGLSKGEMFPDAELAFTRLQEVVPSARLVVAIEPLPNFFLASRSKALEARVRDTPWETLYELSWADLLSVLSEALPEAKLTVLTSDRVGHAPLPTLEALCGPLTEALPQPLTLLREMITETGRAVLDRMIARGNPESGTLEEVYASFARRPSKAEMAEKLGIDKVTGILLQQRFDEDLEKIGENPRIEVL